MIWGKLILDSSSSFFSFWQQFCLIDQKGGNLRTTVIRPSAWTESKLGASAETSQRYMPEDLTVSPRRVTLVLSEYWCCGGVRGEGKQKQDKQISLQGKFLLLLTLQKDSLLLLRLVGLAGGCNGQVIVVE